MERDLSTRGAFMQVPRQPASNRIWHRHGQGALLMYCSATCRGGLHSPACPGLSLYGWHRPSPPTVVWGLRMEWHMCGMHCYMCVHLLPILLSAGPLGPCTAPRVTHRALLRINKLCSPSRQTVLH